MALSARETTCFACDSRQALDSKVEVATREKKTLVGMGKGRSSTNLGEVSALSRRCLK